MRCTLPIFLGLASVLSFFTSQGSLHWLGQMECREKGSYAAYYLFVLRYSFWRFKLADWLGLGVVLGTLCWSIGVFLVLGDG